MQFILNDQLLREDALPADLTILRYVREHQRLVGTKEGCASGDCGACTVMVGEIDGEFIRYQTVNACIAPVGTVAGKHLVTVEHLAHKDQLHPAQTAMIEHHGSQCGFCTPGFVMSLANLYCDKQVKKESTTNRHEVREAISGNLCRCTGYRPIVDAGIGMLDKQVPPVYDQRIVGQLKQMHLKSDGTFFRPSSVAELNTLLRAHPDAKLIAGGTDLMLQVTQSFRELPALIELNHVSEMRQMRIEKELCTLGSAITYSEMERFFADTFPEFVALLKRLGSRQIRNRGTLGGNLGNASPIADIPPILLALDAQLVIGSANGIQRIVDVSQFFLDYKKTVLAKDEYVIASQFKAGHLEDFHRFYKNSKRFEDDISTVMTAVRFVVQDNDIKAAFIAYGGVAAIPLRATEAEDCFAGVKMQDKSALDTALLALEKTLSPMSDVRASADYRMTMAKNLLHKAWRELNGEHLPDLGDMHCA